MQAQAQRLLAPLQTALGDDWSVAAAPMSSQIGSGAMPVEALPSWGLTLRHADALTRLMDLSDHDLLDLLLRRKEPADPLDSPDVREVLAMLRMPPPQPGAPAA